MKIISIFLLFVAYFSTYAQEPFETYISIQRLTEKVLIVQCGEVYPDMIVAIKSDDGIIVIDAGISPTITMKYREIIEKEFQSDNFLYLINTHSHFDHTNGNQIFRDAQIIAHKNCPSSMEEFGKDIHEFATSRKARIKRRSIAASSLSDTCSLNKRFRDLRLMTESMLIDFETAFELTLPNITFSDELIIELSDFTIHMFYAGNGFHSNNDIIISIPKLGLVFTGDIIVDYPSQFSINSDADLNKLNNVIHKIKQDNGVKHVVTIHAGVLTKKILDNFQKDIQQLIKDKAEKKSAVGFMKKQGIDDFNSKLQELKRDKLLYYYSEGDIINYIYELFDNEEYTSIISFLLFVEKLIPNSVDIKILLGEAYQEIENYSKAYEYYNKSLKLYPLESHTFEKLFYLCQNKNFELIYPPK
jgi:glyoxylase-like metal-dependent hydrolase (beta-lactamase superfamily II)